MKFELKEDFFIGSRATDDKEDKFPKRLTCRNYNCYICSAFVASTSFEFSGKPPPTVAEIQRKRLCVFQDKFL